MTCTIEQMAYDIRVHELAAVELEGLRVYDERRIIDEIEKQLSHQPATQTRQRKCLSSPVPTFEHVPPVWELRVGEFRVFYDVDETAKRVHIRAVRRKEPRQTTEEIT